MLIVGAEPQAIKCKGEKTYIIIGRGTVVREFAAINRRTAFGTGVTKFFSALDITPDEYIERALAVEEHLVEVINFINFIKSSQRGIIR